MKSPKTNHRLMALLMISSQVLLTAFVVYWLLGQYQEERSRLKGDLMKEYMLVHEQLVDSMLMKRLVLPSLEDSMMVRIEHRKALTPEGQTDSDHKVGTIHIGKSIRSDTGGHAIDLTTVISDEERMVRSVKLFINENIETFQSDTGLHIYALNLDSSSLVLNMEQALEDRDWTFKVQWPEEHLSRKELAHIQGILIDGGGKRHMPDLQVQHFTGYLIRAIFPQMLFGLILLLLSGSALLFAFRSLQRQLALNRLRDDFIANISHELKTPVSTVKVALEALRSSDIQKDSRNADDYLDMASSELERLEHLVSRVLNHEMLNYPSLVLELELCDLGNLTRQVVQSLEIPIQETGARITISDEVKGCKLSVDRIYVEGVILNLIDNSLKYSGKQPEIMVRIECDSEATRLSVLDKGPGIPEEYKDQVFTKFFRVPAGNTHNVKGYGLGLNFASQVMAKHGGSISFSNLSEGGCCFTLHFPPPEA